MNKSLLIFFFLICNWSNVIAQVTLIPDENFEQELIDQNIDTDQTINGQVATVDIENIITLDISFNFIPDLTGIEDFVSLEYLDCSDIDLTELDVSTMPNLRVLKCEFNNLTSIDLTNNPLLTQLFIGHNDLNDINLSQNLLLETLYIGNGMEDVFPQNWISSIDVSSLTHLTSLYASHMGLESLNVKNANNSILTNLNATFHDQLSCIQVDDETSANKGGFPYSDWQVDESRVTYSEDCALSVAKNKVNSISLFPNPVKETLYMETTQDAIHAITIYDVLGKVQLSFKKEAINKMDVSKLPSGIYFVKSETNNYNSVSQIIKY